MDTWGKTRLILGHPARLDHAQYMNDLLAALWHGTRENYSNNYKIQALRSPRKRHRYVRKKSLTSDTTTLVLVEYIAVPGRDCRILF